VNTGRYSKFIVSMLGTVTAGLTIWYPTASHLVPIITMALASLGVGMIPNVPGPAAAQPPLLSDIVAAVDQLLAQRLRPRPAPQPPAPPAATEPAANVQVLPSAPAPEAAPAPTGMAQ
jgi:hypothetical protein